MDGARFVVVSGPPGSGKSTVAPAIAGHLRLPLIAKDTIKEALMATLPVPDVAASQRIGRRTTQRPRLRLELIAPQPRGRQDLLVLESGSERFTTEDLHALSELVARVWIDAADRDWSLRAGSLEWSCLQTADHAVDCVYAPAFFLASRKQDGYPEEGSHLELGPAATPLLLVASLRTATRLVTAVVHDAGPADSAAIFRRPELLLGAPADFAPRAAMELILHAHDVCTGLQVPFDPPADLCRRLREHTRPWPMWTIEWDSLRETDDPWDDLLSSSGRR